MKVALRLWCRAIVPVATPDLALLSKLTDSRTPVEELVSVSNAITSSLSPRTLPPQQAARIIASLTSRGVRHEPVLETCFWSIYKSPLPETAPAAGQRELAEHTAAAFSAMTQCGFVNDTQLLTLGLGRCIECAPSLSAKGIGAVYRGIEALQRAHFSLTEVGLQDSDVNADGTLKGPAEATDAVSLAALAHQPNLLDVACSALEVQVARLADEWDQTACSARSPDDSADVLETLSEWVHILRSASRVGVTSASALTSFTTVLAQWPTHPMAPTVLTDALIASLQLHERVIDVLNHEESAQLAELRDSLTRTLADSLCQATSSTRSWRRDPTLVLRLRQLFESSPRLFDHAPLLWDQVRSARVSRSSARSQTMTASHTHPPSARLGGRLFAKQFTVKTKRVTSDLSDAEKYVPPAFKTWRSPQHTPRGGHRQKKGTPRKAGFGTRRISKNYLRDRRRRFAQR